jgi:hypothetical protein
MSAAAHDAMCVLSPLLWEHHWVWAALPCVALASASTEESCTMRLRRRRTGSDPQRVSTSQGSSSAPILSYASSLDAAGRRTQLAEGRRS